MKRIEPQYVYRNFPTDPAYTPSHYVALKFGEPGERLFGQILVPDGRYEAPRPCVLLWHGFPGAVTMDDLAHALCRAGCVAVVAHYRGAWGSEGKYLLSHVIEDALRLTMYMHDEGPALYNVDPDAVFLFGHSMGTCASINAARKLPWLRGLILAAPYDPGVHIDRDDAAPFISLMQYGDVLNSDGIDALIEDGLAHRDELAFSEAFPYIKDRNVFLLYGELDRLAPPEEMAEPLWKEICGNRAGEPARVMLAEDTAAEGFEDPLQLLKGYPDAHGLYGCRTEVARDAAEFIRLCLGE